MSFGSSSYGSSFYGGKISLFQVVSATAVNPFTVVVTFSSAPDFSNPETLNPANYFIDVVTIGTTLGVPQQVLPDPDPNSVRLVTQAQEYVLYRVTATDLVTDEFGAGVDPQEDSADFTGYPLGDQPSFRARAIRANGIHLVFPQPMLVNGSLLDTASYTVVEAAGQTVPVLSVVANRLSGATRVVLNLGANMRSSIPHSVTISAAVTTADGRSILPPSDTVVWVQRPLATKVSFKSFTNEVRAPAGTEQSLSEGLSLHETVSVLLDPFFGQEFSETTDFLERLTVETSNDPSVVRVSNASTMVVRSGASYRTPLDTRPITDAQLVDTLQLTESVSVLPELPAHVIDPKIAALFEDPEGLVFFSPALVPGGAPNSSIQVDEISTCTTAYDSYTFPQPVDPIPLYTYTPLNAPTLNNSVLFTSFYRLNEAQHVLHNKPSDTVPIVGDVGTTITLQEVWPPLRVAILNSPGWTLFDNTAPPPYDFITADNLSPFPPPSGGVVHHFVNPSEVLGLVESIVEVHAMSANVAETLTRTDNFDLVPGETVVQVNVSESLGVSDSVTTHIGINLSETMVVVEGLSVST